MNKSPRVSRDRFSLEGPWPEGPSIREAILEEEVKALRVRVLELETYVRRLEEDLEATIQDDRGK